MQDCTVISREWRWPPSEIKKMTILERENLVNLAILYDQRRRNR